MKSNKALLGVLGGVAAGALIGILFAPQKGKKTRKKILSKSKDYSEDLKEKFEGFLETITKKQENHLTKIRQLISNKVH